MMQTRSGWRLRLWLVFLALVVVWGGWGYGRQVRHGLAVTGMSDQITWGLYIGNFTFLVGLAAAAVVLLIMAHLFQYAGMQAVVLLGEAMAVTAVTMSLMFVLADLGQPWRFWHALPFVGTPNFPASIMAWDMVVLVLYLLASLGLGVRLLKKDPRQPTKSTPGWFSLAWIGLVLLLGLSIHTVTAFLLAANPARPLWHSAILAPHFLASALASGSALLILLLQGLQKYPLCTDLAAVRTALTRIMLLALLVDLFFLGSELFVQFYRPTGESVTLQGLFFTQNSFFTAWIRLAWGGILLATLLLLVPGWRQRPSILILAASLTCLGVWMEKGLGLVVPGFIPTPLGEVAGYVPTRTEIQVSVGIWAGGAFLFTILVRMVMRVANGTSQDKPAAQAWN
ncbi:MAG: polysulfide reductase NrfD [Magnetococcus sp. DMHC-1]|nr:polysulfide reductase NrfD [Magnetococcales bacterium]